MSSKSVLNEQRSFYLAAFGIRKGLPWEYSTDKKPS